MAEEANAHKTAHAANAAHAAHSAAPAAKVHAEKAKPAKVAPKADAPVETIYLDADMAIVGRLSAYCAKEALRGKNVIIINSENAVISGEPKMIIEKYYKRRQIQPKGDPQTAPKWPRKENMLLKKIMRGMLPKHSSRGHQALRRITIYIGKPETIAGNFQKFNSTSAKLKSKFITLKKLCAAI